jgi:hypothetical protein
MAKDSLAKASQHQPVGPKPLWGHKGWQLPAYAQHLANALRADGHSESEAIQIAIGTIKRWAAGGGNVDANTRAAAAKALGEWEALKARAAASRSGTSRSSRMRAALTGGH